MVRRAQLEPEARLRSAILPNRPFRLVGQYQGTVRVVYAKPLA
jgi:hypothetical protein